jgi:hypothetical protein
VEVGYHDVICEAVEELYLQVSGAAHVEQGELAQEVGAE